MKKLHLIGLMALFTVLTFGRAYADDNAQLKDQVQQLQARVDQLESQLNRPQPVPAPPMSVYGQAYDPFAQMMAVQAQMDRNMRQAFTGADTFNPRMDMKRTGNQYVITMDLPGMDKDKINVEVKQGMLIVSGERKSEENNNTNQYYRQERSFGSFMQAIPLPEDAQSSRIDAKYNNGVLTVSMERLKKEEQKSGAEKIVVK